MSIDRGLVKNGDHHIVEWSGYVQRDGNAQGMTRDEILKYFMKY